MNERIRELAEQATTIVEMVGPQGYTSSYANFDKEKFAELIVKECGKVYIQNQQDGVMTLTQDLLQHFGVEE